MTPQTPDFTYILKLVKRILPNGYDHESIASELVYRGLSQGRQPGYRSIRNFCISQVRRRASEHHANEVCAERQRTRSSSDSASADQLTAAIVESTRLDPTSRAILIHKFWLGRSDFEIGQALNIPAYRVAELRNQALIRLRETASILFPKET
jgi:DNA-directed RNA polymerase specialized sigma24 family protein